jgi:hypothetical protein
MPACLSLVHSPNAAILSNHAHYCRIYGYDHRWADHGHIGHPALRENAKYSLILRHLREMAEGDWLLFLDEHSAIFHPIAVDALLDGRDFVAVRGLPVGGQPGPILANMLILRNTADNRDFLHRLIVQTSNIIARTLATVDEAAAFAGRAVIDCNGILAGIYVNVSWRMPMWHRARIFVVDLSPVRIVDHAGLICDNALHDRGLEAFLAERINGALIDGRPALDQPAYPPLSEAAATTYNGGAEIAFVTLYTHHINAYARVSEHNVHRYCARHGYAYHVYREVPDEIGKHVNGTWTKAWLAQRHLKDHRWVIWIDADMIFRNPSRPMEPWLAGRDLLMVKDVAGWHMNAGLIGFRNTPANAALLARIWDRISAVPDRSTTYSSFGDQYHINQVLEAEGLTGADHVLDNLSLNTPPSLASDDSFLVHFVGMDEPYRSTYMEHMDRLSQRA